MLRNAAITILPLVSSAAKQTMYEDFWVDVALSPDEEFAVFTLRMTTSSWVGLILGDSETSVGADMIQIDGANKVVYDKISAGYQYPSTDTE